MRKVLVIGSEERQEEFKQLTLQNADIKLLNDDDLLDNIFLSVNDEEAHSDIDLNYYEVVFDLNLDEYPQNLMVYQDYPRLTVFGCAVKDSLAMMAHVELGEAPEFTLFGINSLPTFINRSRMEVSLWDESDREELEVMMHDFGMEFEVVDDRVGMVTPRVICMIINEACFVLGEGTAGIEGVDRAMKLGTNYPKGPFEWADAMGVHNVYEVVAAMKADTGEEKYKVAPTLKKYFLKEKAFYPQG